MEMVFGCGALQRARSKECSATRWRDAPALAPLAGGRLAAGMRNGTIALWNLERGEAEAVLSGHTEAVMALTPFWDNRLASGSSNRTVRLWNLQTRKLDATLEGHTNQVRTLVELPKQRVASGSLDGTIRVWNLSVAPLRVKTLTGRGLAINALAPLIAEQIASGTGRYHRALGRRVGRRRELAKGARYLGHDAGGFAGWAACRRPARRLCDPLEPCFR